MKVSRSSAVLTAAFAGLLGGTMTRVNAAPNGSSTNPTVSSASSAAGSVLDLKKDKHACKGQNACKGKGGCKSSDNGCKGKNSCKGKGGCATDGSPMPKG